MSDAHNQIPLDLGHLSAQSREDFMIAPCNRDAVAWVDRWPEWPAPCMIISGPAASGKKHLASIWAERSGAIEIPNEDIGKFNADELSSRAKHLVIRHADWLIGDRETETVLFHLYNILKEEGRSLLMTMRSTPTILDFQVQDLASRLRAAPLVSISAPDDHLLEMILAKLFADRQLGVTAELIRYVLPRMPRSFQSARRLVRRADELALSEKRAISIPLIRQVLQQMDEEG